MTETGFQRPKFLECDYDTLSDKFGRFWAQPFERGYGVTVGNALRRILLSSVTGAAITAIRIEGVLHEFSTIPGVVEDVTDIILNLKAIPLKLHTDQTKKMTLKIEGPAVAKSSHIEHDGDIEILDPDLPIASLDKDGRLEIEMIVKNGRGYVSADQNLDEDLSLDTIPLDSSHSPIKKVNYRVEPARVGKRIDYESLSLEIWTTGAITPQEALSQSAKLLRDHVAIFLTVVDEPLGAGTGAVDEGDPLHHADRRAAQADRTPGALGPVVELPQVRGHREDLRARPEERRRAPEDQEFRSEIPGRDQGDPGEPELRVGPGSPSEAGRADPE